MGIPIEADGRVVPGAADLVGIFPMVGLRGQIDQKDLVGGDGLKAMEYAWRDLQEDAVVLSHDDGVGFSLGGAAGAVVKKTNLGHAVNHRDAVRLFMMGVPSLDDPGIDRAEVGLSESREMRIVLSQDFHDPSAVVAMLDQGDQLHSVDHEAIMEG